MPAQTSIPSELAAVKDHTRVFQDLVFVYPVISRRSRGLSIGINLNPDKRCNFDCVYCEVDRKTPGRAEKVDLRLLREELTWLIRFSRDGGLGKLPKFNEVPDLCRIVRDIALSGDGEPTMIPNFSECVEVAVEVRKQEHLDVTKLVLITDAAGLDKLDVQKGLRLMDANQGEIWGKLDAGTEEYFRTINRTFVSYGRILKNLTATAIERPIIIQSLFLKWNGGQMPDSELKAYCTRLNDMVKAGGRIEAVHAYTVARPTPEAGATALTRPELDAVAQNIRSATGLKVEVFA